MKCTVQREAVLEEVRKRKHPTANEIFINLRKKMPQLSLGTVYRNLEEMSQAGIIQNLSAGNKQTRFDWQVRNHFHIRCIKCGKIKDIKLKKLAEIENTFENIVEKNNLEGYRFEFLSICKSCRKDLELQAQKTQKTHKKILTMLD